MSKSKGADDFNQKKVEYLTEELMERRPLDAKLRDALIAKCGPAMQEVRFVRNEAKSPTGRPDDLAPSRHERVPPPCVVLMFNPFESSFDLAYGDLRTLPESATSDLLAHVGQGAGASRSRRRRGRRSRARRLQQRLVCGLGARPRP